MIVDVNHYHPICDWGAAKRQFPFLISKATQGTRTVDPTLKSFITNCEKYQIPYLLYCYLNNCNETDQVKFMVDICGPLVGDYFRGYALDIESGNLECNVILALQQLEMYAHDKKVLIYTGYKDYKLYRTLISNRPDNAAWWESRYGLNNGKYSPLYPCHKGVDLYQYSSRGQAPGVSGKCDINMLTGTLAEEWFTGSCDEYEIGKVYTLQGNMYIRNEPHGSIRKYSELTVNAKLHAESVNGGMAVLKKGTRVTVKEVRNSAGTWIRIPSGWICAIGSDKKVYVK